MKTLFQKTSPHLIIITLFTCLCMSSCSRNDNNGIEDNNSGELNITFSMEGISNDNSSNKKASANLSNSNTPLSKEIVQTDHGDYIVSVFEDNENSKPNFNKFATTSTIGSNIKYRLVIIELNPTTDAVVAVKYNQIITGTNSFSFTVESGKKYKWIAYSINSSEDPPNYGNIGTNIAVNIGSIGTVGNNGTPNILNGNDLLYASDVFTTNPGPNHIKIILKRQVVNLRVILNTTGAYGFLNRVQAILENFNAVTGSTNPDRIKNRNFNIFNGQYITETDAIQTYAINDVIQTGQARLKFFLQPFPYDPISNNYGISPAIPYFKQEELQHLDYFIAPPTNPIEFGFWLRRAEITKYYWKTTGEIGLQEKIIAGDLPILSSGGNVYIKFKKFQPEMGKRYLFKIDFAQSGLKVNNDVTWARDNVFALKTSSGEWKYFLTHQNEGYADTTLYPYYDNLPSNRLAIWDSVNNIKQTMNQYVAVKSFFTRDEAVTACASLYPAGYWRLPDDTDYQKLVNYANTPNNATIQGYGGGIYTSIRNVLSDQNSIFDTPIVSGPSNGTYNNGVLIFTHHGGMNNAGQLQNIFQNSTALPTDAYKSRGYYISSSGNYFYTYYTDPSGPTPEDRIPKYELVSMPSIHRANVRCVRNMSFTP